MMIPGQKIPKASVKGGDRLDVLLCCVIFVFSAYFASYKS